MVPNSAKAMPDAAKDEVFPGRLHPGGRAIDADQQHGGQGSPPSTATHITPRLSTNSAAIIVSVKA